MRLVAHTPDGRAVALDVDHDQLRAMLADEVEHAGIVGELGDVVSTVVFARVVSTWSTPAAAVAS